MNDPIAQLIASYFDGSIDEADYAKLEEFVQSDKLRQELLFRLNLHDQQMKSTFDPSVSAKNIGILSATSGQKKSGWDALASNVKSAREEARCISAEPIGSTRKRPPSLDTVD